VPGLVLAVVRNGQVVVERGYGVRTPADPQRPDADTLFYIGSLSKALTGVGVELLAERGKLSLDDPASRYVRGMPAAWQRIPIKLFLAHQSGIPELTVKHPTFEAMLRSADSLPLEFKPGTRQKYNNFNFAVAGKVIEGASGKSYLDFMRQEVFQPLGMTRSGFGQTDPNASPGHYLRKNGQYEVIAKAEPNGGPYGIPSGFIQTTLSDLLRLYRGIQQHKLLTPQRTRELLSPVSPGMTGTPGWFAREVGGVKIVAKNGAAAGYSSQFQFAPARGDCVIFLMNLQHQQLGTDALAQDLLRDVCGLPLGEGRRGNSEE
jgi:CubicO group peptidase (beta-lactamase class C family)